MKPEYEALSDDERVALERRSLSLVHELAKREYKMLLERQHLEAWFINRKMMDFEEECNESDITFAEGADVMIQENFCDASQEYEFYKENDWLDTEIDCITDVRSEIAKGLA